MDENIAKIYQIVLANLRLIMRSIPDQVNTDRENVQKGLIEDLGMWKVCAKLAQEVTDEQKERKIELCTDLLETQDLSLIHI